MAHTTHHYTVQEALNILIGQLGWDIIQDTNAHTGSWTKILCLQDTVFAVLTDPNGSGDPTTVIYPQGTEIVGNFTAITLTSGQIHATRGN